jgi:hypothetical protein
MAAAPHAALEEPAAAARAAGPSAVPITHAEPLAAAAAAAAAARPAEPAETAVPSPAAAAAGAARPAAGPSAVPITHAEPLAAAAAAARPAEPAETAVPSPAAAAAAAASSTQSAIKPQRAMSGATPPAVAALLARGDTLIALGDIAAARLVYQRAAAHASARAATATGRTYDPRFLQAIGAIGSVADLDAAAAWYRKGAALGDEDAGPLLGGLDVASQ